MGLIEDLANPVEYLKEIRDNIQARNEKQLFFEEQFQIMVENGNVEKAADLIYDEAENLNIRLNAEITPEKLARYCIEKSGETGKSENFEQAIEELKVKYDISTEE